MLLLALETATSTCSAAVMHHDTVVAEAHLHRPRVHAKHLTPLVDDVLQHADVRGTDLDAVAVSMGPGSYTGLRIGVSTAKGWAMAHGAALIGVPTLEALAAQARPWGHPGDAVCAVLDARRNEVYASVYRMTADRTLQLHAGPDARAVTKLADAIGTPNGTCWLLGDGGAKSADALRESGRAAVRVVDPDHVAPSASWVARRAQLRWEKGDTDDVAFFEPFYLKAFHGTPSNASVL